MQIYNIQRDEKGRELTLHGDSAFPCAGYDESFSRFILGEVPWHWHEEIEIVVVYQGSAKVEYLGGTSTLGFGEGIFINANTAHRLTQISSEECKIINFVFKPGFLGGRSESLVYRDFINPVCSNKNRPALKFSPDSQWQKTALNHVECAFEAYTCQLPGFEITVLSKLLEFWKLICINEPDMLLQSEQSSTDERRIKEIMEFINSHFMNAVGISDLADAAGISESECYRLFSRTLRCSPGDYLLKFRLEKAAEALKESEQNVSQIALDSGFGSPAYFSKKFREYFHKTPREFRKKRPSQKRMTL